MRLPQVLKSLRKRALTAPNPARNYKLDPRKIELKRLSIAVVQRGTTDLLMAYSPPGLTMHGRWLEQPDVKVPGIIRDPFATSGSTVHAVEAMRQPMPAVSDFGTPAALIAADVALTAPSSGAHDPI
jgi:hypothetical protein